MITFLSQASIELHHEALTIGLNRRSSLRKRIEACLRDHRTSLTTPQVLNLLTYSSPDSFDLEAPERSRCFLLRLLLLWGLKLS